MSSTRPAPGLATRIAPLAVALLGAAVFVAALPVGAAQSVVPLGTAESFAVLAGSGITNTGATTITGDIGSFPTPTETGVDSITLVGTDHAGDAVTQGAKDDLVTAYDDAFGRMPATSKPVELGGTTLTAGVYTSPTFGLTGTLTLDSGGNPDATFVFQAGSTLITEVNSRVLLIGVDPCHVVWQVGSSATFKTGTDFVGDVLAYTSITAQRDATFRGRLLARNGAVTLDTNTITKATCLVVPPVTTTTTTPTTVTTTTPTTVTTPTPTTVPEITPQATPTTTPSGTSVSAPTPSTETPTDFVPSSPLAAAPAAPPTEASGGPSTGIPSAPPSDGPSTPANPPFLPVTGTNAVVLMWTALVLLAVGGALILVGRRGRVSVSRAR